MTDRESPLAGDMTAIAPEQRGAYIAALKDSFALLKTCVNSQTAMLLNYVTSQTFY